jgi:hypothetical protein
VAIYAYFTILNSSTINDLLNWLNGLNLNATFSISPRGAVWAWAGAVDISYLKLVIAGNTEFNMAFTFDANIVAALTARH